VLISGMSDWLPIETAPERETILVWAKEYGCHAATSTDHRYEWWLDLNDESDRTIYLYPNPTHWMRLPKYPPP
jgi:hypothetical protein